jgi:predicted DNA-binding antitoxin AbrB/MazE fold protein
MLKTVQAIYENGVFRPVEPVDLPDHTAVEFEPRVRSSPSPTLGSSEEPSAPPMSPGLAAVYAILGERYESGETDTAARHNEHQP